MKLGLSIMLLTLCLVQSRGQNNIDSSWSITSANPEISSLVRVDSDQAYVDSLKHYYRSLERTQEQLGQQQAKLKYERLTALGIALLLGAFYYSFLRKKQHEFALERKDLLKQVEQLKKQQATWSISAAASDHSIALHKTKIEQAIGGRLGESSWLILNLLLQQPAISNKTIAKEVSLSVEGVSSSLRRMYTSFDVKAAHNKKVALITKAVRISMEKEKDS